MLHTPNTALRRDILRLRHEISLAQVHASFYLLRKAGYDPGQPRDWHGRWSDTGAGSGPARAQPSDFERYVSTGIGALEEGVRGFPRAAGELADHLWNDPARGLNDLFGPGGYLGFIGPNIGSLGAGGVAAREGAAAIAAERAIATHAESISTRIGSGHAFGKHVVRNAEFPGITTQAELSAHVKDVIRNADEVRYLRHGRTAYWQDSTGTIVIHDPAHKDAGTIFRPGTGKGYFDDL